MRLYVKAVVKCDAEGCGYCAEDDLNVKDLRFAPAIMKGTAHEE